jgi:ABC-type multidrug transport system permease subunit
MHYRAIWLLGFGFFFGSMFGRESFGHWITAIAAVAMLVGIFGDAMRKKKQDSSELPSIPPIEKHEQIH